jgi:Type IIA topoisomerase (DNA gyrase/topo II, topoisomerase IV), B subunit
MTLVLNWKESVLRSPDVYIGDIHTKIVEELTLENESYVHKKIPWNDGFYNCLNEILYNALDQKWRDNKLTYIQVYFDKHTIKVKNDGKAIPIEKKCFRFKDPDTSEIVTKELYPPEVYFGIFYSGTNYSKTEEKLQTSGKNGMGIKIVNVLCKSFQILCSDGEKTYKKVYYDNCSTSDPYIIVTKKSDIYVDVTANLDNSIFKFEDERSILSYLEKLLGEISYIGSIPVTLNDKLIHIKDLVSFLKPYNINLSTDVTLDFSEKQLKILFIENDSCPRRFISFVNGAFQKEEGSEVKSIRKFINKEICTFINTKLKLKDTKITGRDLKNFVLYIELFDSNVKYDHQTKRKVTTVYTISSKISEKNKRLVEKSHFYQSLNDILSKKSKVTAENFEDAIFAGTLKSEQCKLFITEGESAKGFAIEGISYLEGTRQIFGVFPVKGKFLNISKASLNKQLQNKEVQTISKILNLSANLDYNLEKNRKTLRYGKVILLTDSDDDGIHIKALLMNFFYCFNKTLYDIKFVHSLNTPIIRIYFKTSHLNFYTDQTFREYMLSNVVKPSRIKYYKGLGSHSEGKETKDCFINIKENEFSLTLNCQKTFEINFHRGFEIKRRHSIVEVLSKNDNFADLPLEGDIACCDYLTTNLNGIFHVNVLKRHLPNFIDGLKDSQRKIVFTVVAYHQHDELNVERLAGKVSERTLYHHGSKSLEDTIINLAQSYVGSNNIPFFIALGRVGTRYGDDSAAGRYVSVKLNPVFKKLFFLEDILEYNEEEFEQTEPREFYPPLPFYLINGSMGITTGFKTEIYPYNLKDILVAIRSILEDKDIDEPVPYFNGFKGEVTLNSDHLFTNGNIELIKEGKYRVTELPVTFSVKKFKFHLESLKEITKIENYSTNNKIDIVISSRFTLEELQLKLKLKEKLSLKNITVLRKGIPVTFTRIKDLLKQFVDDYLVIIEKRKLASLVKIKEECVQLENKIRFIECVRSGVIDIRESTQNIVDHLRKLEFAELNNFSYLLNLCVSSFFNDSLDKYKHKFDEFSKSRDEIASKSTRQMYLDILNVI